MNEKTVLMKSKCLIIQITPNNLKKELNNWKRKCFGTNGRFLSLLESSQQLYSSSSVLLFIYKAIDIVYSPSSSMHDYC